MKTINPKIIIVVILILLATVGIYFIKGGKIHKVAGNFAVQCSFFDLILYERPLSCTFSNGTGEGITTGVTYVSGDRVRIDMQSPIDRRDFINHVISDGSWLYTWSNISPGYKASLSSNDLWVTALKSKYNLNCSNWVEKSSLFELPPDHDFPELPADK